MACSAGGLRFVLLIAIVLVMGIFASGAFAVEAGSESSKQTSEADQQQGEQQTIYKKRTVYDFEDDTITGDLTKPDGEYIDARRKAKHQNLIRIREDFKEKVLGSVSKL